MNSKSPLIVVLSRNYSTGLGVIRSLGAAGHTVDLVASTKKEGSSIIASSSKYLRKTTEVLSKKIQGDKGEDLMKLLLEYENPFEEKMILFPTDDFTAAIVAKNQNKLSERYLMPYIKDSSGATLLHRMNKKYQGELARACGLLTPMEWQISLKEEIEIPKDMKYPCFVKPLESINGRKDEMRACENKEELHAHLKSMKAFYEDRKVLAQEFLNIEQEYDLSGLCLDDEIIIPGVLKKTRIAKHERGVTMCGKMVTTDVLKDIMENVIAMLKELHYVGMFDMEFNLCDGKLYFNEVNLRSGGPNFSYFLSGVNLPEIFVKEILGTGHDKEEEKIETFGKTFIYEKVAWEDYIYHYMSKKELDQSIKESDYTLLAYDDDPKPGEIFNKRIRLSLVKNRIKMFGKRK